MDSDCAWDYIHSNIISKLIYSVVDLYFSCASSGNTRFLFGEKYDIYFFLKVELLLILFYF